MDPGGARGTRRHVVCFKSEIPEIFVRPLLALLVALPGEQGVQLCCKVLELVMHKPPQCPDNESLSHRYRNWNLFLNHFDFALSEVLPRPASLPLLLASLVIHFLVLRAPCSRVVRLSVS